MDNRKIRLLVGFSGSVATIKDSELINGLFETDMFEIRVIYTKSSLHFRRFQ
jgi:hypothetical protein